MNDVITLDGDGPLKVLTTGDNHLGYRQYKSDSRRQDYMDSFCEVVDIAIEEQIDAVINKGDLFNDPDPDINTIKQCTDGIKKLQEHNIPFLAIVGNHERKQTTQWLDLLNRLSTVHRLSKEPLILQNDSYGLTIYGIDAIRKYDWNTTDLQLSTPDPAYQDYPKYVAMHELVSPPIQEGIHDYKAETLLQGFDVTVDMVGLSDYHQPVEATVEEVPFYYSGSTEKTAYDEQTTHSVVVLNVTDEIQKTRIDLSSPRPFKTVQIEMDNGDGFVEIKPQLNEISMRDSHKKPVIIVKLSGEDTGIPTQRIREYLIQSGAEVVNVFDDRGYTINDIDSLSLETDIHGLEESIDKSLQDLELSETANEVNKLVRNTTEIPDSNVREQTKQLLKGDTDEN
jgi:DNA repair exonuclease SbcCD nuclease subunit